MPKDTFFALCTLLRAEGLLADTRNVAVEEQVAIFMAVVGKRGTNRSVQETFQHSGETVHRHIHAVLAALLDLFHNTVRLPSPCTPQFRLISRMLWYAAAGKAGAADAGELVLRMV